MTTYKKNNNDQDRNAKAIVNHFSGTKRVRLSACGNNVVNATTSDGFMTLSDIRIQDFVGCQPGGVSMSKENNAAGNSGSFSHWTELNNCSSVERAAANRRSYNLTKEIVDKSIDNRSMSEPAKNLLSHEVKEEEEEDEDEEEEEEEEEEATDTAPILACTRVITPHRFHTKTTTKARTNKNKITTRGSGCESIINKSRGRISDSITDTAFSSRNNKCSNYKNTCPTGDCAGSDPKDCDGSHSNNCFHPSPPSLISNHNPHNLHHCCLDESQGLFSTEVFAADVCFVKNSQVVSQGPNFSIAAAAAAGNTHNHARESLHNGSASTSLVNPVSSSSQPTSFFSSANNPISCAVTSSNVEDFDEGGEGGLRSGVGEGGPLTTPVGRRGPATTTCSFTSLSSASGAGCTTTSSSLPAWSSPHAMGEHCHSAQASTTQVDKLARNQLIAVSALCCIFMTCEIVGGILSNSLALFTDVLHLGSDLISFFIGLLALFLSTKPATESMSFGYHRIEVLGAVVSVLLIWLVSGILCYVASQRIITENYKNVYPDEMLLTASLGVLFNVVMGFVLHSDFCCKSATLKSHGHSHNHLHNGHSGANSQQMYHRLSQEPTENTPAIVECQSMAKPHQNVNIRAAIIHVMGDIIQSTGVLVAALIIKFTEQEKYKLADPICTFVFSIIVLCTTFNVLRDTICVIMEGVPQDINYKKLRSELETLDHVKMVHNLCVWSLTLDKNAVSVHLALDELVDTQLILEGATAMLRQRYKFQHITIQVERYIPTMSQCPVCLMPA